MPASSADNASPARLDPGRFFASALQLGLLLHAIRVLHLEESFGLVALTPVVFFGFLAHAWFPARLKLPVFLLLTLTALVVVLGALPAAILVALSLGLFGICHLPVSFAVRAGLLLGAGALLIPLRVGSIETSWAAAVLPVLGSMFMFRSAVYLYDLRTEREPASIWMRLSYFFLLPNVCFLLFPVVDYRTFQRTYYEEEAQRVHQRGLEWMLRGVVHLLLYRVVYFYMTPAVPEIQGLFGVVRFVLSSYLLYLRISGHFHLIVGMLHLFGFHLPETNHNYLFASSFTDTWRRINVYWTEFMKKLVYYPAFMRLRRHGMLFAMAVATALTFLATWLLHAYQWFWLNGSFPLASDGLFWGLAGMLALGTTLWEAKRGPGKALERGVPTWTAALSRSVQAFATFCLICVIWSLWCSPTLAQWLAILGKARHAPGGQAYFVLAGVTTLLVVASVGQRIWPRLPRADSPAGARWRSTSTAAGILLVAALGHAPFQATLGESLQATLAPITTDALNTRDRERQTAGYYDRLIEREGFGGRVWEEKRLDPDDLETFMDSPLVMKLDSATLYDLFPSSRVTFLGAVVETNRFGMRDREYTREKPEGTFRIALLGTCYELGTGVTNDKVWEGLAEERLNREVSPRTGLHYEILNCAIPAYAPYQQLQLIRDKLAPFDVDVVVLSNHLGSSVKHLIRVLDSERVLPEDLRAFFAEVGAEPGMDEYELRGRLGRHRDRIELQYLGEIAATCRELAIVPVLLDAPFLDPPALHPEVFERRIQGLNNEARAAGFELLDISRAWEGLSYEEVAVPLYEHCPSPLGHRKLSDEFCDALLDKPSLLGFP